MGLFLCENVKNCPDMDCDHHSWHHCEFGDFEQPNGCGYKCVFDEDFLL